MGAGTRGAGAMTPGFKIRRRKDGRQAKLTRNQSAEEDGEDGLPRGLDTFCFFAAGVKASVSIQHGESRGFTRRDLFGGWSNRLEDMTNKIGNDNIHDWIGNSNFSLSPIHSPNEGVGECRKTRFGREKSRTGRLNLGFQCFNWNLSPILLLHYFTTKYNNNTKACNKLGQSITPIRGWEDGS